MDVRLLHSNYLLSCPPKFVCLCFLLERPEVDFSTFISTLNRQLKPLNLELAQSRMEDSPALWCGLVNRSPDAAAKISSKFSPAELELFNKVVSERLN